MKKTILLATSAAFCLAGTATAAVVEEHQSIQSYEGPQTCIACHQAEAEDMLNSLHMQWSGPTPDLSNTNGESLGNVFCKIKIPTIANKNPQLKVGNL